MIVVREVLIVALINSRPGFFASSFELDTLFLILTIQECVGLL